MSDNKQNLKKLDQICERAEDIVSALRVTVSFENTKVLCAFKNNRVSEASGPDNRVWLW